MAADTGATEVLHGARKVGRYALLIFVAFLVLFPIYATLMQALKSGPDTIDHPRSLLPIDFTLDTLRAAWRIGDLGRLLLNSLFVAVVVTIGVIVTSVLAAYAFAFLTFPGKGPIFVFFLATLLVPAELTIVVNQRTIDSLGWTNSYQGLIVPLLATTFGMFLVRQVFLTVPKNCARPQRSTVSATSGSWGGGRAAVPADARRARPVHVSGHVEPVLVAVGDHHRHAHRTIQIGLERLKTSDIDKLNLVTAGP